MLNAFKTFQERSAHFFNRFTIRSGLFAGFALVIALGTFMIALTEWTGDAAIDALDRFIRVDNEVADLCLKSIAAMGNARRNEKDFVLTYKEFGFNEARSRYITRLQSNLADVKEFMERIRRLADNPEAIRQAAEAERAIGQYQDRVLEMVKKYEAAGSYDSGLEGAFRETAHEMEELLKQRGSDLLIADLLEMRRKEKDFILRNRDSDAAEFRKAVGRFRADAARSGLPPGMMGKLAELTDTYRAGFEAYVQTIEEIRTIKSDYLRMIQVIEPALEKLYVQSNLKAKATLAEIKNNDNLSGPIKGGTSLLLLLVSLLVALAVSLTISKSVAESSSFAKQIAAGGLEKRLSPKGKNEFATLAHALNGMAESLQNANLARQKHTDELRRSEEEIRKLNQGLELKVAERTRELAEAQQQLVHKEKLALLGQLGGSIGNELRNPLGVMNNAVYFLNSVLTDADGTVREYLDIIKDEIDGSQQIISDFLDAASTKPPRTMAAPLHELVRQAIKICAVPENIQIQAGIPETLPNVLVDPLQTGQVFRNLITNAAQAMPNGGCIRVSARRVGAIHESPLQDPKPETDFVEISFADTGEGIAPENMKKIFQPLFTTKARGIGLGLVVCRNLVEVNGGRIEVESRVGEGTTFRVMLPVGD